MYLILIIALSLLQITRVLGNPNKYSNYSDTLALRKKIETLLSDYSSEYDSLHKALKISEEINNKTLVAECRGKIGNYYARKLKEVDLEKSAVAINYQRKTRNYTIILFLFVIGILVLIFNRYKINLKKSKYLLQKHTIEIENKLLRSQMNPHFIFNALYSIQSFVAKNQSELAVSHLSNFATLMRAILHNSGKSFISLDKELETIELYLKLEKLRFENRFDYTIDIPADLDLEFIQIPPMLVQPFIENSIIHGFSNKKEKGKLAISFKEIDNLHLLCEVSDDGIGRKKSKLLKKNNNTKHKSMGLDITQKRLELLNNELETQGKITIRDLDKENKAGTIVEIFIPIKVHNEKSFNS